MVVADWFFCREAVGLCSVLTDDEHSAACHGCACGRDFFRVDHTCDDVTRHTPQTGAAVRARACINRRVKMQTVCIQRVSFWCVSNALLFCLCVCRKLQDILGVSVGCRCSVCGAAMVWCEPMKRTEARPWNGLMRWRGTM